MLDARKSRRGRGHSSTYFHIQFGNAKYVSFYTNGFRGARQRDEPKHVFCQVGLINAPLPVLRRAGVSGLRETNALLGHK